VTVTVPVSLPAAGDMGGTDTCLPTLTSDYIQPLISRNVHNQHPDVTKPTPVHISMSGADIKFRCLYVSPPNYKMLDNDSYFFKLSYIEQCNRQS
jgi:hypothetical protein